MELSDTNLTLVIVFSVIAFIILVFLIVTCRRSSGQGDYKAIK